MKTNLKDFEGKQIEIEDSFNTKNCRMYGIRCYTCSFYPRYDFTKDCKFRELFKKNFGNYPEKDPYLLQQEDKKYLKAVLDKIYHDWGDFDG